MCGIAGVVRRDREIPPAQLLAAMGDSIAHRGPDDAGYYSAPGVGLVHRRLSIIDLSARAHQPMTNEDATVWLTFNGEIYNYKPLVAELSSRGHRFASHTDSEVILHAYEEMGPRCLERFNGMFAFAIWDEKAHTLFAARDRLGIKPFYYAFDGQELVFGSEIKALMRHPGVSARPNRSVILEYLLFGHTFRDATCLEGVHQLPPGHFLLFDGETLRVERYWDLSFEVDTSRSLQSFADELREGLIDSVRLHLQSDVPLGAHLSGGVDSSTVVALAARQIGEPLHTFSGAFAEGEEFDERRYIRTVVRALGTQHREVVPSGRELPALLPRLLWHLDEPVVGAGSFPQYRVSELVARSGVKVVNGGQGGDELFGGYPSYFIPAGRSILKAGNAAPLSDRLRIPEYVVRGGALARIAARLPGRRNGHAPWLRVRASERAALFAAREAAADGITGAFERATYLNVRHYLPALLHVEDRMSMAWSIESRVPLLDYRLAELAARMPAWVKIHGGSLKYVLRQSMRGIVPDEVLDRRDKKGFPTPVSRWLRDELSSWARAIFADNDFAAGDLIDPSAVTLMLDEHVAGVADHGATLWAALNVAIWWKGVENGWSGVAP
jgi:asparagine synthase (glutamine-hydrolysing)